MPAPSGRFTGTCATGFFERLLRCEGRSAVPAPHAGALPPHYSLRRARQSGEAAKRVSAEVRGGLASLDWKSICGMRDVLIHDYIGVDLEEVWNVASARIPELQAVLEQFLDKRAS